MIQEGSKCSHNYSYKRETETELTYAQRRQWEDGTKRYLKMLALTSHVATNQGLATATTRSKEWIYL